MSNPLTSLPSFLQAGCSKVFITSRKAKACQEAIDALNALPVSGKAISIPADISKPSEIERLVEEVGKHTDHVDILFANAGATWGAEFDKHPESAFSKVMDLNVKSVFVSVQKYVEPVSHPHRSGMERADRAAPDSPLSCASAPRRRTPPASS